MIITISLPSALELPCGPCCIYFRVAGDVQLSRGRRKLPVLLGRFNSFESRAQWERCFMRVY